VKRRSFISSVVAGTAGLSGCTGLFGGDGTDRDRYGVPERDTTETPTGTPDGSEDLPWKELSNVARNELKGVVYALPGIVGFRRPGISFVAGFHRHATGDHPATFAVGIANLREVPAVLRYSALPVLAHPVGERVPGPGEPDESRGRSATSPGDSTLAFAPIDRNDLVDARPEFERQGDFWRLVEPLDVQPPDTVRIDPGETLVAEHAVVGGIHAGGREPGTYRFCEEFEVAVWEADSPGPVVDSRFEGSVEPPRGGRTVTWYHEADLSTSLYIEPSTERTDLPGLVDFHLVNHSTADPGCGGWALYKHHDGEWYRIYPDRTTFRSVCRFLGPGATAEWSLRAYNGDPVPSADEGAAVGHLGGGRYAVLAGYGVRTDAVGALFEIEADPVEVGADEDVVVEEDGADVVVAAGELAPHEDAAVTVRLTRSREPPETTYLAEQLLQPRHRGIRNALAFFEPGVESVTFRAAGRLPVTRSSFDVAPDSFAFDGRTYGVSFEVDQ
jgi:hypothetical protein